MGTSAFQIKLFKPNASTTCISQRKGAILRSRQWVFLRVFDSYWRAVNPKHSIFNAQSVRIRMTDHSFAACQLPWFRAFPSSCCLPDMLSIEIAKKRRIEVYSALLHISKAGACSHPFWDSKALVKVGEPQKGFGITFAAIGIFSFWAIGIALVASLSARVTEIPVLGMGNDPRDKLKD